MIKEILVPFIWTQKQKQLLTKVILTIYLNQSILWYFDSLGKDSNWINDPFIDHNINISKYNPVAGSIYFKLPRCPARIRKVKILFGDKLDFKDIKMPVKIKDIHKNKKKRY